MNIRNLFHLDGPEELMPLSTEDRRLEIATAEVDALTDEAVLALDEERRRKRKIALYTAAIDAINKPLKG